jgi:hypothetical protein
VRSGTTWSLQQQVDGTTTNEQLGYSVAISGDTALMGAVGASPGGRVSAGSAYLYVRSGTTWSLQQQVDGTTTGDSLGSSVAISGDTALLGANNADPGGRSQAGSVYIYAAPRPAPNGTPCMMGSECASTFCADGVCCNSACGGGVATDCQACSKAAGAAADGTCGAASNTTVCRPQNGGCDVADSCDGTSTACPNDAKRGAGFPCRAQNGACDVAESCDGTSSACPMDGFASSGTSCRAAAGPCDAPESCTGMGPTCPGDAKRASGTVCRAALGACDVAEVCDGSTNGCPANALRPPGFVCKAAGASATCDPADTCDGMRSSCPASFASYGIPCGTGLTCNGTGRCL